MSQTIDNRIVEMQFENKQFESGVQESLSTLDKLKQALKFDDASKNLQDFGKNVSKNIDLSGITNSIDGLNDKFSASGIVGMEVIRKLTDFAIEAGKTIAHALDAPFAQIRQGGWKRAMNIEDAKFQLKGLGIAWETVADDINFAVADTAYGLDAAAKACSQLSASGIQAGESMKAALRGISGVASMGNTEYENITQIFTKAAGNGKVMADELNRISQYGLNARAEVVKFFNDINSGAEKLQQYEEESGIIIPESVKKSVKSMTEGKQLIESDLNDLVKKGKLRFEEFSYAMDYAFGKHAKDANETFMGSLRNIKAALSKIGAEFATPIIHGAIPIFNEIRIFLNDLRKHMGPIFDVFSKITNMLSGKFTDALYKFRMSLLEFGAIDKIGNAIKNVFTSVIKIFVAVKNAFQTVFPPAHNFARVVDSIAGGIENFSKHLVISDGAMLTFRNIMVVVFNILKAVAGVIKNILPIATKALSVALKIATVIVGLVGYLINLVANLNIVKNTMNAIQKAGGLFAYAIEKIKETFSRLKNVLSDTTTVTGRFFTRIKEAATTGAYLVGGALYLAFLKIKEVISYFDNKDPLGSLVEWFNKLKELPAIEKIINGIEKAIGALVLAWQKATETVIDFVKEIQQGKSILDAIGTTVGKVVGGIISAFTKLTTIVKEWFSTLFNGERVIEETIESPIYGANGAMTGFVKELSLTQGEVKETASTFDKAKSSISGFASMVLSSIHNIDTSRVVLAIYAGMVLVIAYNINLLIKRMSSFVNKASNFWTFFKPATTRFEKFRIGVVTVTAAIAALAGIIYMLKDVPTDKLEAITNSLLKLVGLAGGLSLIATIITELMVRFGGGNGFNVFTSNMFMLSAGVLAIVGSLKILDSVNMEGIWKKVAVLGAIGAGLTAFSVLMSKFAPQLSLGSVFMLAFAGSMLILVKALDNLSHVQLDKIVENYKELSVIIVAFAGFAALAGTVGVSSILSLIAFLVGIRTLLRSFDAIKGKLEEYHVGALLVQVCKSIKEQIKAALNYLKGMFDSMSEFDKKAIGWYIALGSGGLFLVLIGLSKAAKYVKKMAVSATIFALAVTGVMVAVTKIAQVCNTIPQSSIDKAIEILAWVGGLFTAVVALSAIFGGETDVSWDLFGRKGKGVKRLFGKQKIGGRKFKRSGQAEYLKQARKMMFDMAVLLASVALFCNTIGKLTPDQLSQAIPILAAVGAVMVALMIAITAISSHARSAGRASASLAAFVGIIAVIGTLLGSFVLLSYYFKNFDPTSAKDWISTISAIVLVAGAVFGAIKVIKAIKLGRQQSVYKSILAFTALLTAIGLVSAYIAKNLNKNELIKAGLIAGSLLIFMGAVGVMVLAIQNFSNKFLSTAKGAVSAAKRKAFATTMVAIIAMVGSMLLLAGTLYSMSTNMNGWDVGRMALISTILTGTLAAISAIVLAIQHFSKDKRFSLTKESSQNIKQTSKMLIGFLVAFEVLGWTLFAMAKNLDGWDTVQMAAISIIISSTLAVIAAIVLAIQHFSKDKRFTLTKDSTSNIKKTAALLAGFLVAFEVLGWTLFAMAKNLSGWDVVEMAAISATIVGTLALLTTMGVALQAVVKKLKVGWADIGKSGVILGGMLAAFEVLTLIFFQISKLNADGIVGKAHAITLTLLELEALAVGMVAIGKLASRWFEVASGGIAIAAMIGMFELLTLIFAQIDKLDGRDILAKSQSIILALAELEVLVVGVIGIGALLAGTGGLLALGAAGGILMLWGMVELFKVLAEVFTIIDGMHLEGLKEKSDIIMMALLELEGLSALSIFDILGLIGSTGISSMVNVFGTLSEVFTIIDGMHLEGLKEKADIIVDTLLKLEGLSALGGIIGGAFGNGLIIFANGLSALGTACASIGNGLSIVGDGIERLTVAIEHLVSTGPGIQDWFNNVAVGVTTLSTSIMVSVTGLSKSVVAAVNTLIVGIVTAITAGGTMIFAAAVGLGNKMKQGFDSVIKPKLWGADLVKTFASGIMSNLSPIINAVTAVAKIIRSYLHFTNPDVGPLSDASSYMPDMMSLLGNGITSNMGLVLGPVGVLANGIKDKLTGIDLSSAGQFLSQTFANGISSGSGGIFAQLNSILQAIGLVKGEIATMTSSWAKGQGTLADREYQLKTAIGKTTRELDKQTAAYERLSKNGTRSGETAKKKAEETKKVLEEQTQQLNELYGASKKADEAVNDLNKGIGDLGESGKKAKGSTKEISDEIANFYDSMEGAINLFEEFNKQTELTSDQLLSNMRSQIEGMTEWANNIQKLAFMGIDQGLLQQLADMGPQGYEYTNAFVHMTAEQLQQANNLYHQSLMLPAKVTSQIYGSYTVAGRSAASGFLMGMNRADLKEAAVGFAHQVVDEMNLALDIQAGAAKVTYEDGVAVVNGVKTGMQASDVQAALGKATELLTKEKITDKFRDGLFTHNTIYNVGANITKGLADGVKDEDAVGDLVGAVTWVGNKAKTVMQDVLKEKSPSRVFMKIGNFITLGLAKGITDETQAAVNAMDTTADSIIDTMRETINKANEALIDDVDEPVITPILDLSEIQNGSRQLNNMLSRNSAFSASRSFSNLQNEQWNSQNALLNATMDNTDIVDAVTSLNEEVATLKDVMANIKVVLDTGTMVGAMTPAIDQSLGMRQVLAGRGI